mgnify:CR=1 FL=1
MMEDSNFATGYAVGRDSNGGYNNGGMFGNDAWWIIILLLFGYNGIGFGGFGGGFDDGFGMDFGVDGGMQMQFGLEEETAENGEEGIFTNEIVVLQTAKGMFLRFPLREIPEKKKGAIGVRGIKLDKDDYITDVYVLDAGDNLEVDFKGKKVELRKLKTTKRDGKGTKVR